ncbi:MAG: hypothetical protein RLY49_216 [Candidatus Parcubacteria bacterium]|jgi:hypothetical protein
MVLFFSNKPTFHMNPLKFLDSLILFITKKIARWIYLLFGINNFLIARILIVFSVVVYGFAIVFRWHSNSATLWSFALSPFGLLALFSQYYLAHRAEVKYKRGFANINRINFFFLRLYFLITTPFILLGTASKVAGIMNGQSKDVYLDLAGLFDNTAFIIGLLIVSYLISIEPEDPTDSLLKKLLQKFKSLFDVRAIPQPA